MKVMKVFYTVFVVVLFSDFPMAFSNVTGRSIDDQSDDFTCSSGKVIFARFVCDGEFDCGLGDKSDELNCSELQNSRESNESMEELMEAYDDQLKPGPVDPPGKVTRNTLEDDATTDDSLHEDVAAIGRSWYKRFARSSGRRPTFDRPSNGELSGNSNVLLEDPIGKTRGGL